MQHPLSDTPLLDALEEYRDADADGDEQGDNAGAKRSVTSSGEATGTGKNS